MFCGVCLAFCTDVKALKYSVSPVEIAFLKNGLPAINIEVIVLTEPEYANARGFQTLAFAKGV